MRLKAYYRDLTSCQSIYATLFFIIVAVSFLLIVDYYDYPSHLIASLPLFIQRVLLISLILVSVFAVAAVHPFRLLTIQTVIFIDTLIVFFTGTSSFLFVYWLISFSFFHYKTIVALIISILLVAVLVYRIVITQRTTTKKDTAFDLKDIYYNNFEIAQASPVLISDHDVSYDLLKRKALVNQLVQSITNYRSSHSFCIGLEGDWGSGKTTIMNLVKLELKNNYPERITIIDQFDFWMLGSQKAIMLSLFDTILDTTGIKLSPSRYKRLAKSLLSTLLTSSATGSTPSVAVNVIRGITSVEKNDYEIIEETKARIEAHLRKSRKVFAIFIDNIDRASSDNILFLFKLIATYLDFPNVIYILAYERDRINSILKDTHQLDPHFTDKVIHQSVVVPQYSLSQINLVCFKCLHNLLVKAGIQTSMLDDYEPALKTVAENVQNLRVLKRFINSTFNSTFVFYHYLSKRDLFSLEIIRFFSPALYNSIYENRQFFISYDRLYDEDVWRTSIDLDGFNKRGKAFLTKLQRECKSFFPLLASVFPYVDNFNRGRDLELQYDRSPDIYQEKARQMSICSAKYFDLYFSYCSNEYLEIGKQIKDLITAINKLDNMDSIYHAVKKAVLEVEPNDQKEWADLLQIHMDQIKHTAYAPVVKALCDLYWIFDDTLYFMVLNARSRTEIIISLIFERIDYQYFSNCIDYILRSYNTLFFLSNIIYWLEKTDEVSETLSNKITIAKERLELKCQYILENHIDLFSDANYQHKNILGLIRVVNKTPTLEEVFKEYIASIVSKHNIYRLLADCISESVGQEYGYSITKERLAEMKIDEGLIDELLRERTPHTENERFVHNIYVKYKSTGNNADYKDASIFTKQPFSFKL